MWRVTLVRDSGRRGAAEVEADEFEVVAGGYLVLSRGTRRVCAFPPGSWVSIELEDDAKAMGIGLDT